MSNITVNETPIVTIVNETEFPVNVTETPVELVVSKTEIPITVNETPIQLEVGEVIGTGGTFLLNDNTKVTISNNFPLAESENELLIKTN